MLIGMELYKCKFGEIPKSYYNNEIRGYVDNYYIEPIHFGSDFMDEYKYKIGGDCPKSYANGVCKRFKGVKLPVLTIFDNFISKNLLLQKFV